MTVKSTLLTEDNIAILQVATSQQYAVTSMFYCNTTEEDGTIQVYIVADGRTPTNDNKIIHNLLISPGDTFTFDTEKIILDSGDAIYANVTPSGGVSCTVSYVRVA
jgi:hypothetical protein